MTEPDAQPADPPVETAEPVDEPAGRGHLVGAPPFALSEEEGGQAAVVGHPDVPDEALPLVDQPESLLTPHVVPGSSDDDSEPTPSEEQAQPEADAAG